MLYRTLAISSRRNFGRCDVGRVARDGSGASVDEDERRRTRWRRRAEEGKRKMAKRSQTLLSSFTLHGRESTYTFPSQHTVVMMQSVADFAAVARAMGASDLASSLQALPSSSHSPGQTDAFRGTAVPVISIRVDLTSANTDVTRPPYLSGARTARAYVSTPFPTYPRFLFPLFISLSVNVYSI